jgi:hypothetical protein
MKHKLTACFLFTSMALQAQEMPTDSLKNNDMQEFEIKAYLEKKPLITQDNEKMSVTVENNPLFAQSGTAFDVLKKTPKIFIDQDQKIQVAGKGAAKFLVNGKPIGEEFLKSIQSTDIASIEVIENPPAKYASISKGAPLINIVLIKNRVINSAFVQANSSFGMLDSWTAQNSVSTGINKEKYAFKVGYGYNPEKRLSENFIRESQAGVLQKESDLKTNSKAFQAHNYHASIDYNPNSKNTLSASYYGSYRGNTDALMQSILQKGQTTLSDLVFKDKGINHNVDLNYQSQLDSLGKTLSLSLNYTQNDEHTNKMGFEDFGYFKVMQGQKSQYSALRYAQPFGKTGLSLETGVEYSFLQNKTDNNIEKFGRQSFLYQENKIAVYGEIKHQIKKLNYSFGINIDETWNVYKNVSENKTMRFNYSPRLNLNYAANEHFQTGLGYNLYIRRPSLSELDPIKVYETDVFYRQGNPNLKNGLLHSINWNMALYQKLFVTVFYGYRQNDIKPYFFKDTENEALQGLSFGNISSHSIYGNVVVPYQYKMYQVQGVLFIFHNFFTHAQAGIENFKAKSPTYGVHINQTLSLALDFEINLNYSYRSFMYYGGVNIGEAHRIDLALSKYFLDKKIRLSLSYDNIAKLSDKLKISSEFMGNSFDINQIQKQSYLKIAVSVNLGKALAEKTSKNTEKNRLGNTKGI